VNLAMRGQVPSLLELRQALVVLGGQRVEAKQDLTLRLYLDEGDREAAVVEYRTAAEAGHIGAMFSLGLLILARFLGDRDHPF
jgi:TPR repeat protein